MDKFDPKELQKNLDFALVSEEARSYIILEENEKRIEKLQSECDEMQKKLDAQRMRLEMAKFDLDKRRRKLDEISGSSHNPNRGR